MKAVIFLGPSLPLREAQEILDAIYLPPAQQADLLTAAVNYQPDVIGLVDGVFQRSLSVWHKEILYALDLGILLFGASSMGALRAAETSEFGMIGVGEIYRRYASGELQDDDEVALAHASADQCYRKVSEPMVNVRATFAAAEKAGIIDAALHVLLNAIAKQMYFAERTFPTILGAAAAEGVAQPVLEALSRFVKTNYVDLKRQDAIDLLKTIKYLPSRDHVTQSKRKEFKFCRSTFFRTLYNRDRSVQHEGISLPLESISNYVAIHDPNFDDLNFNALNRSVVFAFAELLRVHVRKEEVDAECVRFRKKRGIVEEAALSSWLKMNHLSDEEFRQLMSQRAYCRHLHRWLIIALCMERTTKVVLDELRMEGRYVEWVARVAAQERLLETGKKDHDHAEAARISLENLLAEHQEWTQCNIDTDVARWVEEAGFHDEGNLKMELSRARAARRVLLELLAELGTTEADKEEAPLQVPSDTDGSGCP